jgi:hypothetical protein
MPTHRFRLVEPRLLWEVGLPVLLSALVLIWQLSAARGNLNTFVSHVGPYHINWLIHNAVFTVGGLLVWQWLWRGTQSYLILGPEGVWLQVQGRPQWFLPWKQIIAWRWERDLFGFPYALSLLSTTQPPRQVRFGVLWAGRRYRGLTSPAPDYRLFLEALTCYLPPKGPAWNETLPWAHP